MLAEPRPIPWTMEACDLSPPVFTLSGRRSSRLVRRRRRRKRPRDHLSTAAEPASVGSVPEDEKQPEVAKNAGEKLADSGRAYLNWAKGVADSVPNVQKMVDGGGVFHAIFKDAPKATRLPHYKEIRGGLAAAQSFFDSHPPATNPHCVIEVTDGSAASSFISSANYAAMDLVTLVTSGNQSVSEWAAAKLPALQEIQQAALNIDVIAGKLALLYPGSEAEFKESLREYDKCRSENAPAQAVGILMRNVLQHLYGHLLDLARRRRTLRTKNEVPWSKLAPLVARGGPASSEAGQLAAHAKVYSDLTGKLSDIAKKRKGRPAPADLEAIYGEYLAFLFAVLGWVDLGGPA